MKKATSKYISILGILTLVILGSQMLMQTTISDSKSDARIINISGRQRMLSQKITKASLKLVNSKDLQSFEKARKELESSYTLWNQSHEDLQYGSAELNISEMNRSEELGLLYDKIAPHFNAIQTAATYLVNARFDDLTDTQTADQLRSHVAAISAEESEFLNLMNKITFQYDRQASGKVEQLATVEYYLMGITLLLILIEAMVIFRPMYKEGKAKNQAINELSELRIEEKAYASTQIEEANQRIISLKQYAFKLKAELDKKSDDFTKKLSTQMAKYSQLAEQYERLKTKDDIRRGNFNAIEETTATKI